VTLAFSVDLSGTALAFTPDMSGTALAFTPNFGVFETSSGTAIGLLLALTYS